MATVGQWVQGARPRTLPAAVAPVLVGAGAAAALDDFSTVRAGLALVVGLAIQVGVNYANDYSDGIRGTDAKRAGPLRLVGSGVVAKPATVKYAAFAAFGVAAVAGLGVVALAGLWWLIAVGAASIAAAWFYTGGTRPYGYSGLGELSVFVFFGLVAVLGTTVVQAERVSVAALVGAVAVGLYACAILVANNVRDVPTDAAHGKRTLAVLMGDRASRWFWLVLVVLAHALALGLVCEFPWAALSLLAVPLLVRAALPLLRQKHGRELIPTLRDTALAELVFAIGLAVGLALG